MREIYTLCKNTVKNCKAGVLPLFFSLTVIGLTLSESANAQLSLTNATPVTTDFSNTMQTGVGTNTSTAFTSAGFSPNPTNATPGRLNSNAWAFTGWSDGPLTFGGTQTAAGGDYAKGATAVAIISGGIYAYTGAPASVANPMMWFQPGGSDFTPGTMTLKIQNNGATIINALNIAYKIYQRNDQARSQSFNLSYSNDDITYTPISALDYATPTTADALGVVLGASQSYNLTGISIPTTTYFYLRWSSDDISGSGARDEIGIDDIVLTANYVGACTPPTINATVSSFSSILSNQFTVNYTRGNGTGGMLAVVSPAALSSNPISGITYTANSNYGSGAAIGNGFVVYNSNAGSGSFTVTGLTAGTAYVINLFEYDVSVPCYVAAGATYSQTTAAASGIGPSQFRSPGVIGNYNWANANTWQYWNGSSWAAADRIPTSADVSIQIQSTDTVDITSAANMDDITIDGKLTLSTGGTLTLNNGAAASDMIISNGGVLQVKTTATYATAMSIGASAVINVATGGKITIGNGASTPGYSPLGYTAGLVTWNDASVFEWNTTDPFITAGSITYFPGAAANVIPIFRITKSPSLQPGASTPTVWNGLFEVNANLTLKLAGTKTFRNGIIGSGDLTQDEACGQFIINGATAKLGGTGAINLNTTTALGLDINNSCVTMMTSNKVINSAGTGVFSLNTSAALYCDAYIVSGSGIFTLATGCTLRLGDAGGITASGAVGNIQTTGLRTINTNCNYIFNYSGAGVNQSTGSGMTSPVTTITVAAAAGKIVTLTNNNTSTQTLTLTSGYFGAGVGQQLNILSGGTVTVTSGDFTSGNAGGIINFPGTGTFSGNSNPYDVYASGGVNFGAGTVTIQNGGSFRINAGGFASVNGPFYADGSTLVYNTGGSYGVGNEWLTLATLSTQRGGPFNVTLLASGTSLNHGAAASSRTLRGNMTINSGTTLTLSTAAGGDLNVGGNWTRTGGGTPGTFVHNNRSVAFNGTATQTITVTGGGTEAFAYMTINKTAATSLTLAGSPNATNVNLNGGNAGGNTLGFISGDIDLNQNTFTFSSYNGGQNNIQVDGTTGNLNRNINSTGGQGTFAIVNTDAVNNGLVVIARVSASSARRALLFTSSNVKLTIGGTTKPSGINFGVNVPGPWYITTVNGIFEIESNGFVSTNPCTFGAGSSLIYNTTGTYNRGIEWGSTQTHPGWPANVVVQNNTTLILNNGTNPPNANRYCSASLSIASGSTLTLNNTGAYTPNVLKVGGNFDLNGTLNLPGTLAAYGEDIYVSGNWTRSATGVFNPNDRAVYFDGTTSSTITANGGETFPYLRITKTAAANTVLLADNINITKELSITTGTFNPQNKDCILKSDANYTANLTAITAAQGIITYGGTGRFIVERYIPTATGGSPNHTKSWQLLAVPVNGDNQTINAAWQEGQAPLVVGTNGLGTIITNNVAGTGFDIVGGVGPSMKTYQSVGGTWQGISATNITHYDQRGYMIFVRGDRNAQAYNAAPTVTTLRTKGKVFEPNSNTPPTTNVGANLFASVGNPYASQIDLTSAGVSKTGSLQDIFYIWDPRLGGVFGYGAFQTFTRSGATYNVTPGGGSYPSGTCKTIESGQAFFVHTSGGVGAISFAETAKSLGTNLVTRVSPAILNTASLNNRLYAVDASGETRMVDGVLNEFDASFSNAIDKEDAIKMANTVENLGIARGNKLLAVEHSKMPGRNDSIPYHIGQLFAGQYRFEFEPKNIPNAAFMQAYLLDRFLNTYTPVSMRNTTTNINFVVNANPASYAADRFVLVFRTRRQFVPIATKLDAIKGQLGNALQWNAEGSDLEGNFEIERSEDGIKYTVVHTVKADNAGDYNWVDENPLSGVNYYRVHNPDPANKSSYSNMARVVNGAADQAVNIFPNPVTGGLVNVDFRQVPKGNYEMRILNSNGQVVFKQQINIMTSGFESKKIKLPAATASGIYRLEVQGSEGLLYSNQLMVN